MKAHHRTTAYFYLVSYRYLYFRLTEKIQSRYTGKQLLWFIFVPVGERWGDFPPSLKNLDKIRIFPAATRKYLGKIKFFRAVTRNISANKFFMHRKRTTSARQSLQLQKKWSRYEKKIFFLKITTFLNQKRFPDLVRFLFGRFSLLTMLSWAKFIVSNKGRLCLPMIYITVPALHVFCLFKY